MCSCMHSQGSLSVCPAACGSFDEEDVWAQTEHIAPDWSMLISNQLIMILMTLAIPA